MAKPLKEFACQFHMQALLWMTCKPGLEPERDIRAKANPMSDFFPADSWPGLFASCNQVHRVKFAIRREENAEVRTSAIEETLPAVCNPESKAAQPHNQLHAVNLTSYQGLHR